MRAHENLARVRFSKAITLGSYVQMTATVVTTSNVLVTLKLRTYLVSAYKFKMENGISEVAAEQAFVVFRNNFGAV